MKAPAIRGALLALAVFVFALTQFLPAVDDREFHRDEARWIHRAVYIRDLFSPLDDVWDEETWLSSGDTMDEQYRLRAQPPLGSYIMGIGFLLQDGFEVREPIHRRHGAASAVVARQQVPVAVHELPVAGGERARIVAEALLGVVLAVAAVVAHLVDVRAARGVGLRRAAS